MGKPSRKKTKKPKAASASKTSTLTSQTGQSSAAPPDATTSNTFCISFRLRAKLEFHEANVGADGFLTGADSDGEYLRYDLNDWENKKRNLMAWFSSGCSKDKEAELWFVPGSLDKAERSKVHKLCEAEFDQLKSVSQGTDELRQMVLIHKTNTKFDKAELSVDDEKKANILLSVLREQGKPCSVDEVKEMIGTGKLSDENAALLAKALIDQEALGRLLDAIKADDVEAAKKVLEDAPQLLKEGVRQVGSLDVPLHIACAAGAIEAMTVLLDGGANIEQVDGKQRTPLVVARQAEQSDAEGLLLQRGAMDPGFDKDLQTPLDVTAPGSSQGQSTGAQEAPAVAPSTPDPAQETSEPPTAAAQAEKPPPVSADTPEVDAGAMEASVDKPAATTSPAAAPVIEEPASAAAATAATEHPPAAQATIEGAAAVEAPAIEPPVDTPVTEQPAVAEVSPPVPAMAAQPADGPAVATVTVRTVAEAPSPKASVELDSAGSQTSKIKTALMGAGELHAASDTSVPAANAAEPSDPAAAPSAHGVNGKRGRKPGSQTTISEIQPASPRKSDDSEQLCGMLPVEGDATETTVDAFAEWFQAVSTWCKSNPVIVGSVSAVAATAGVVAFAFTKKK